MRRRVEQKRVSQITFKIAISIFRILLVYFLKIFNVLMLFGLILPTMSL